MGPLETRLVGLFGGHQSNGKAGRLILGQGHLVRNPHTGQVQQNGEQEGNADSPMWRRGAHFTALAASPGCLQMI